MRVRPLRPLRPWLLPLLLTLAASGCGGGASPGATATPTASACSLPASYSGPALHAPPPASSFPQTTGTAMATPALPTGLRLLLDQQVQALLQQTGAPAITAAIDLPGLGRWSSTQGLARVAPAQPVSPDTRFYWASIAKVVTATLVLQLVEEGRLSLDDRLAKWYPRMPLADQITVAQLLTHTSGLAVSIGDPLVPFPTLATQLERAYQTPLAFCPGTQGSYANTGYWMLALVLEAVAQQPYHALVQQRIAAPLGLKTLRALLPGETEPLGLATPHLGLQPQPDPAAWQRLGAGNVIATVDDMLVFWQAVLSGRLLASTPRQRAWAQLYPLHNIPSSEGGLSGSWFGQGVMLTEFIDESGRQRTWLNHLGGIPSANAVVLYDPDARAYAAIAVNSAVSAPAVANALLKTISAWQAGQP